jgi:hypothetical protein
MDSNLLAMPGEYTADFNLKLDHQNRAMSERLVEIGYNLIVDTCPTLPKALSRANPAMMGMPSDDVKAFETAATNKLFGALQKYQNAVGTLLAMCKRASSAPFDTLIVPSGTPEIASFGLASTAKYSVSGISEGDRTIVFGSDAFRSDPMTGLNVGVSRGATSFHDGTTMPQARPGCLSETHVFYVDYSGEDGATHYVDHKTNTLKACPTGDKRFAKIEVVASSAIIGVAGAGHLALGYPTTSTFTQATSPEETTVQLRTYLGAYMESPESVLVLPNVFIDGVASIEMVSKAPEGVAASKGTLYKKEGGSISIVRMNDGPLGSLDKLNGLSTIMSGISTVPLDM